jgi:hypothetical protein
VLARIPQDRVPDVELHAVARYRLAGETEERTGTVVSVAGEGKRISAARLAAEPVHSDGIGPGSAMVLIAPESLSRHGADGCEIGRAARVLLPTHTSASAVRWMRAHR